MKNILIYMEQYKLKPVGGPAGYLYNLKSKIIENEERNISFINAIDKDVKYKKRRRNIPKKIIEIIRMYRRYKQFSFIKSDKNKISNVNLEKYDVVHFHNTIHMYMAKDSLKDYKGKVIITSHSPKPMHLEVFEDYINDFERKYLKKIYKDLEFIDEYAFNRADYIIFPCKEAEEPYMNNWTTYEKIKERNKEKYKYLLTGINKKFATLNRIEICKKYNIPQEAFIICYVGRHNETKGYDKLKIIGEEILKNKKNVYFLVAGEEKPIEGLKNERWIEAGWTDDPHSIIGAADIFILPNKETYFDIVMLEVLSLGKIVIASNTGGNKYFSRINHKGVELYDTMDQAIGIINKISNLNIQERNKMELDNSKLYEQQFTTDIFYNNYLEIIKNLDYGDSN